MGNGLENKRDGEGLRLTLTGGSVYHILPLSVISPSSSCLLKRSTTVHNKWLLMIHYK